MNCWLDTDDGLVARRLARSVRERDGGLGGVRALGIVLDSLDIAQVSMNLVDLPVTGLEAACTEAIAHGVHSADVVLNILARQRDPGPPVTILTPAALTLHHAPVADCARYDNLRRTV